MSDCKDPEKKSTSGGGSAAEHSAEHNELEKLQQKADAIDVRSWLQGESLERMRARIQCTPGMGPMLSESLEQLVKDKDTDKWNCDDISMTQSLFSIGHASMYDYIAAYCKLHLPNVIITTPREDRCVRLRFDAEGAVGMSITSWKEIHLLRYSKFHPDDHADLYSPDEELGYDDIHRFADFGQVCKEIQRVETLMVQRRKRIAESNAMQELRRLVCMTDNRFLGKAKSMYQLCDEGFCIELAAGVEATIRLVDLLRPYNWPSRMLGKRKTTKKRRRTGQWPRKKHDRTAAAIVEEKKGELVVRVRNIYTTDRTMGWIYKDECTAQQVYQDVLLPWLDAHTRRKKCFQNSSWLFQLDGDNNPCKIDLDDCKLVLQRASDPDYIRRGNQDVRLFTASTTIRKTVPLQLWATIIVRSSEHCSLVMYPKIYKDDSGSSPSADAVVLQLDVPLSADAMRKRFSSQFQRLMEHYSRVYSLLMPFVFSQVDTGKWVFRTGSGEVKTEDGTPLSQDQLVISGPRWDDLLVHSPPHTPNERYVGVDIHAHFDTECWGIYFDRFHTLLSTDTSADKESKKVPPDSTSTCIWNRMDGDGGSRAILLIQTTDELARCARNRLTPTPLAESPNGVSTC